MTTFQIPCNKLSKKTTKEFLNNQLDKFKNIFSKNRIEQIGYETGYLKRSGKITPYNFLFTMLLSSLDNQHASLERMCDLLKQINHKKLVSAQSLMERVNANTTVDFLKKIYEETLKKKLLELPEIEAEALKNFSKILLQDSSTAVLNEKLKEEFKGSGGRASKAMIKFDVIYDYKGKNYEHIEITDQRDADQKLGKNIEKTITQDSLVIRDLGYLNIAGLTQIISNKAFFLSRVRSDTLIFLNREDEKPIDIYEYVGKKYKNFNTIDIDVFITKQKLPVRMVIYKAPQEVVNKRRREMLQTAKKQGRTLRDKTLRQADFTIFITNVSRKVWEAGIIGTIYRIRWQIELIFKCWKSNFTIHYLKGINRNRIMSLVYARLILILLANMIYKLAEFTGVSCISKAISMTKVYEWMKNREGIVRLLKGKLEKWEKRMFLETISKVMCKQKRKRKSTLILICEEEIFGLKNSLA